MCHPADAAKGDVATCADDFCAADRDCVASFGYSAFRFQTQKLMLQHHDWAIISDCRNRQPLGVVSRGRYDNLETGNVRKHCVKRLRMLCPRTTAVSAIIAAARAISGANHQG